jgi:DNA-binding GntR family transcriptional regulator
MPEGTKADELALALEQAIVRGELAPGQVLRQDDLSERYGVSRTPVREALRRLAALGLVSFEPNRGVRVRTLSREELREAFLVRAELESLATEMAVPHFGAAELEALRGAHERYVAITTRMRDMSRPLEERARLTGEWLAANYAFHDVIYEVADAPLIGRIARSARRTFLGQAVWAPGGPEMDGLYERNVAQHRAILDAIAAGSATGARALAREHVLDSGHLLEVILDHVTTTTVVEANGHRRASKGQVRRRKRARHSNGSVTARAPSRVTEGFAHHPSRCQALKRKCHGQP